MSFTVQAIKWHLLTYIKDAPFRHRFSDEARQRHLGVHKHQDRSLARSQNMLPASPSSGDPTGTQVRRAMKVGKVQVFPTKWFPPPAPSTGKPRQLTSCGHLAFFPPTRSPWGCYKRRRLGPSTGEHSGVCSSLEHLAHLAVGLPEWGTSLLLLSPRLQK